jgi:hypothetical protein
VKEDLLTVLTLKEAARRGDVYQWRTQDFFQGGFNKFIEDRVQRERESGGGSPLVWGSAHFTNE